MRPIRSLIPGLDGGKPATATPAISIVDELRHHVARGGSLLIAPEVGDAIAAAEAARADRMLTVHQSRRWDRDFMALREVVSSGRIGEVFNIETSGRVNAVHRRRRALKVVRAERWRGCHLAAPREASRPALARMLSARADSRLLISPARCPLRVRVAGARR